VLLPIELPWLSLNYGSSPTRSNALARRQGVHG
jgi:hypothetical protein